MSTKKSARPAPPAATPAGLPTKLPPASVDLTTQQASTAPPLPHERDEAAGMTGGARSKRVEQGGRDLKRGLQDTSRAPEADSAYKKLKQP